MWHAFASVSSLIAVGLPAEEVRRTGVGTRVGKVQMMFCESAEVRRQTFGLTEENKVAVERAQSMESGVERYSPVAAIPEVGLEVVGQIRHAEEGKD